MVWYSPFTPEVIFILLELHKNVYKEVKKNIWDEKSNQAMIKYEWLVAVLVQYTRKAARQ